jgi:membrane protein
MSATETPKKDGFKDKAMRRLAALRRRWRWLDLLVRGFQRFQRDEGPVSAVHIAYAAFFSIFPLLFVAVGVFGFILRGDPGLQERVLAEVKANFPGGLDVLVAPALDRAAESAGASLSIGLVLLLYSGTGMVVAIERGLNRAFGAAKAGNLVTQRGRAFGWLCTVGLVLALSVALGGAIGGAAGALLELVGISGTVAELAAGLLAVAVSFLVDVVLFLLTFTLLTSRGPTVRQALPGAVGAAVWWGLLKSVGAFYVQRSIDGATAVFGPLAVVVGLLVFINLAAQLLLLTASVLGEAKGIPALPEQDDATTEEELEAELAERLPGPPGQVERRPVAAAAGGTGGAGRRNVAMGIVAGLALGRLLRKGNGRKRSTGRARPR